jgi:hypothetical protein
MDTYTPRHRCSIRPADSYSLAVDVRRAPAHRADDAAASLVLGGVA